MTLLRNKHAVPLSSQRFMAWSVSLCSGHNIRYYTSSLAVSYHGWRSRRMRGGIKNVAIDGIGNLSYVEAHWS